MSDLEIISQTLPAKLEEVEPLDLPRLQLAELLALGYTIRDIADRLGCSESWVRVHKKDPKVLVMSQMFQMEALEAAKATLVNGTAKAAETLVSLVDNAPPMVRLAASKDILDRFGLKAPEKKQIEATVNVSDMTRDERIRAIRDRASRLGLKIQEGVLADAIE